MLKIHIICLLTEIQLNSYQVSNGFMMCLCVFVGLCPSPGITLCDCIASERWSCFLATPRHLCPSCPICWRWDWHIIPPSQSLFWCLPSISLAALNKQVPMWMDVYPWRLSSQLSRFLQLLQLTIKLHYALTFHHIWSTITRILHMKNLPTKESITEVS